MDMTNGAAPRKLSTLAFTLACETLEAKIEATFKAMRKASKAGDEAEVARLSAEADRLNDTLFAFCEEQLSLHGEKAPSAPTLAA